MWGSLQQAEAGAIYEGLSFGPIPENRPYTCIDMVATIDGKTIDGTRGESVVALGSKTDHELMRRIDRSVDAVLLGAGTLRATDPSWQPQAPIRVAMTHSGKLDYSAKYFEKKAIVACGKDDVVAVPDGIEVLRPGDEAELLQMLRSSYGVQRLLILGGSETNAKFLAADLIDELFLTIAPKVKLGRETPTFAGGEPLPREKMLDFTLIEHHQVGDELFLRYRRKEHA